MVAGRYQINQNIILTWGFFIVWHADSGSPKYEIWLCAGLRFAELWPIGDFGWIFPSKCCHLYYTY